MNDDYDDREAFFNRRTDKVIVSRSFPDNLSGKKLRIASQVVNGEQGLAVAKVLDEVVLRRTQAGRYEIKATFVEDDRSIRTLTIQKYTKDGPVSGQHHFSFVGTEIGKFLTFIDGIENMPLDGAAKVHISDKALRELVLNQQQAKQLFSGNPELFLQLAQHENLARDLVAVGYRRGQLARFEALLTDADHFATEQTRLKCRPEDVWQDFFEANTWIFGYGLFYQFSSKLDDRKLQQIARGNDLAGAGKRADAVMKTRGVLNSLCYVEIKRHDTSLLGTQFRPDVWSPHADLVKGVAQAQATAQAAIDAYREKLMPADDAGNPTGEVLFNIEPRCCLVIGSLSEFQTHQGPNISKFRSFELYRRNTWRPEIITFDELLERARFIVEHGAEQAVEGPAANG